MTHRQRPRHRYAALTVALLVAGCTAETVEQVPLAWPDRAATAATATAASAASAISAATMETGRAHAVVELDGSTVELTYPDAAGQDRTILAQLRRPPGEPPAGGRPVVVWSHGGADGKDAVGRVGDGWTRAFHEAGYLVVAIAHTGRELSERHELCDAIGVEDCDQFKYLTWDRPVDAAVVFDWLEDLAAAGEPIDLDHLVYGGHSAGSVSVLTVAGMTGHVPGQRQPPGDPRPVAFLAASPPGASTLGLDEESVAAVARPLLVLTGAGDDTDGSIGVDRQATFELLPVGPAVLGWVDDPRARHTTFDLDLDACRRAGGTRTDCRALTRSIADLAIEWATAVHRDDLDRWRPADPSGPLTLLWRRS